MQWKRSGALTAATLLTLMTAYASSSSALEVNKTLTLTALFAQSYRDAGRWLCHPGLAKSANVCAGSIDTTNVDSSGQAIISHFQPLKQAPVDCFYVYPTTSADPTPNSDFLADAQEIKITEAQAARYSAACRVFAPIYRQRTLPLLAANVVTGYLPSGLDLLTGISTKADAVAYADVRSAFRTYLDMHNQGRGFILIGHSQGATLLKRLIAEDIETDPALRDRMISAHLLGSTVEVPVGADVGGTFAVTPACRHPDQTGCVVAYSSYRKGDPELSNPRYGRATTPNMQALCNHPMALAGGPQPLDAALPMRLPPVFQLLLKPRGSGGPYADRLKNATVKTAYFMAPGQIQGECVVDANGTSYLEVRIATDSSDARADDYAGEFFGGTGWGLHLLDISIAQNDLVQLAKFQSQAWLASH